MTIVWAFLSESHPGSHHRRCDLLKLCYQTSWGVQGQAPYHQRKAMLFSFLQFSDLCLITVCTDCPSDCLCLAHASVSHPPPSELKGQSLATNLKSQGWCFFLIPALGLQHYLRLPTLLVLKVYQLVTILSARASIENFHPLGWTASHTDAPNPAHRCAMSAQDCAKLCTQEIAPNLLCPQ